MIVIPAQAGIQESDHYWYIWIPACAGMTVALSLSMCHSGILPEHLATGDRETSLFRISFNDGNQVSVTLLLHLLPRDELQ